MTRTIALEEHFRIAAIHDANREHPLERMYGALAEAGFFSAGAEIPPGIGDLDSRRIADMDAAGIDVQVLSHTVPAVEALPAQQAATLASAANDAAAEAAARHSGRFAGLATLPVGQPQAAVAELTRTVREYGFVGAMINGHVSGRYLDDPEFWSIFECAEALGVPIYLHPNRPPESVAAASYDGFGPVVSAALATGAWGWHVETGLHALRLIIGGVFDRFPTLQVILGHMGEGLPAMIWRADSVLNPITALSRPVHEYFRENFHLTTSALFDQASFAAAVTAIGIERIMFSGDYPYSSNLRAREFLDRLPLYDDELELVSHRNAERLLGLSLAPTG
jgi:uncharacterized protein